MHRQAPKAGVRGSANSVERVGRVAVGAKACDVSGPVSEERNRLLDVAISSCLVQIRNGAHCVGGRSATEQADLSFVLEKKKESRGAHPQTEHGGGHFRHVLGHERLAGVLPGSGDREADCACLEHLARGRWCARGLSVHRGAYGVMRGGAVIIFLYFPLYRERTFGGRYHMDRSFVVRELLRVARMLTGAATPEQKEVAKLVKRFFKSKGIKVSMESASTKSDWVQAWSKSGELPKDLRAVAVQVKGGAPGQTEYGTVQPFWISMHVDEWHEFLKKAK